MRGYGGSGGDDLLAVTSSRDSWNDHSGAGGSRADSRLSLLVRRKSVSERTMKTSSGLEVFARALKR